MKSLFLEFKELFEMREPKKITAHKNGEEELVVELNKRGKFELDGSEQYRFRDLLWRAGLIPSGNNEEIAEFISQEVENSFLDNRQLALALDTSVLLLNQVGRLIGMVSREYQRKFTITRVPLLLATQATQYEFHHMASSDRHVPSQFPKQFNLPQKIYKNRGQRGKFGAFMLQTLMDRYPLILAKPGFPMLLMKTGEEEFKYANISPTSPVFDILIVEQFTQLAKISNLEILFLTTDANLSKVANQSGLKSFYLAHPSPRLTATNLNTRQLIWVLVTMLWNYDYVYVDEVGYCMARNSNGKGANLYFKKTDNRRDFLELNVADRVF